MALSKVKGKVYSDSYTVNVEFGRSQISMAFSKRGKISRINKNIEKNIYKKENIELKKNWARLR